MNKMVGLRTRKFSLGRSDMFIEPTPISSSAPLGARYISLLKELHSIGGAGSYKYFGPTGRKNACFKKAESGQGCPRSAARDGRAPCAAKSARRWYLKDGRKLFVYPDRSRHIPDPGQGRRARK